jgi:hypothetical protein
VSQQPPSVIQNAVLEFRKLRELVEKSVAQVDDEQFFAQLDPESNSIAILLKHLAGNMLSRWTDFLTSDGEKPDRDRDGEFVIASGATRAELLRRVDEGWKCLIDALEPLTDADLGRTVMIRGEPHSVLQAIHRQLTHYGYHVGQVVFLARHLAGARWKSLSIPRGRSQQFNASMKEHFDR